MAFLLHIGSRGIRANFQLVAVVRI